MFWRWAALSRTLLAVTPGALSASLEVQPPSARPTASAASAAAGTARGARRLFSMSLRRERLSMPPAAAERLKERGGVGVAAGLSLHQVDARLLIGLLGAEEREVRCVAVLPLTLREVECGLGRIGGGGGGLQLFGILGERRQRIGHVLTGGEDRAAILRGRLVIRGLRGALLVQQGSALEDGRGEIRPHRPEAGAAREQLIDGERGAAGGGAQGDIGQAVGHGDAYPGAGRVQVGFRLTHVWALRHEVR